MPSCLILSMVSGVDVSSTFMKIAVSAAASIFTSVTGLCTTASRCGSLNTITGSTVREFSRKIVLTINNSCTPLPSSTLLLSGFGVNYNIRDLIRKGWVGLVHMHYSRLACRCRK